ncbi:hypothetical protein HHK36_007641 [Tetracentron sinense]|uniref:Protein kinase domain-containing protein n=1 Tax=Tetracentron sinense TaxID=13715 RepID=A0A834ZS58_TETSI|nr:hypothetical protein HHK36_007641 [Tetracentron sinense]
MEKRGCNSNTPPLLLFLLVFLLNRAVQCQETMSENRILTEPPSPSRVPQLKNVLGKIILGVLFGSLTGFISAILFACSIRFFVHYMNKPTFLKSPVIFSPQISPKALHLALSNQNHFLGSSPNGKYYRTVLDNGLTIAVKRLQRDKSVKRRIQQQDLEMLASLRNRNLMSLRAYIREPDRFSLVYDYAPNGSLEDAMNRVREHHLQLGWETRHRIAVGVIKGLHYLHFSCTPRILHYNLKPRNVMLDSEFEPRLADCGLAKPMPNLATTVYGYTAPECFQNCRYTDKSDIFSFGVILGVLLTGRDPLDPFFGEATSGEVWDGGSTICSKQGMHEKHWIRASLGKK